MLSRIAAAIVSVAFVSTALGYATFAFFSDTETSADNVFSAGTIDLKLSHDGVVFTDGVTATLGSDSFAPGDTATGSVVLKNTGTLRSDLGDDLDLDIDVQVSGVDSPPASVPDLDSFLCVTEFTYGATDLKALVVDPLGPAPPTLCGGNPDPTCPCPSLADMDSDGLVFNDHPDPLDGRTVTMTVLFDETGPNHLQGDKTTVTLVFQLAQSGVEDLNL